MNKTLSQTIILFIISFLYYQNLNATGIGIYTGTHIGSASFTQDWISTTNNGQTVTKGTKDLSPSIYGFSFGFVMDTKVAENKLVNYRLNVGFNYSAHSHLSVNPLSFNYNNIMSLLSDSILSRLNDTKYDGSFYGLEIGNTIGFGFFRNKLVRLWAGPKIVVVGNYGVGTSSNWIGYKVAFGGAPVVGANFNFGSSISVSADMGWNILYGMGGKQFSDDQIKLLKIDKKTNSFSGMENHFFINISLLFRSGDNYSKGFGKEFNKSDD